MALYLLDSDAVIDVLNRVPRTLFLLRSLSAHRERLCICAVVLAEVYAGLQPRDEARARSFLPTLLYLATSVHIAEQAGRWRYQFARVGRVLPTTDVLIAATAVSNGATVITGNVRDYPMPELSLLPLPR